MVIVQGPRFETTRFEIVADHRCEDQARGSAGGFLFHCRISTVINCHQDLTGAFAGVLQRHRGGWADSIATGNSALPVLDDILATATFPQPDPEAGQFVIEKYLVGLAARQPGNARLREFHGPPGKHLGSAGNVMLATLLWLGGMNGDG